jgi:hypothetical protein
MNNKIDNMVDLRAFCLGQSVKMRCEYIKSDKLTSQSTIELAKVFEQYILGDAKLPDQPFNTDKLLCDTMTDIIKNKEENVVKTRLY